MTALEYKFRFVAQDWVVVGPPDQMRTGEVQVKRSNGEIKTETIVRLLPPFDTPDGPRQYGLLRALPRGRRSRAQQPRYSFPVEVRRIGE